MKVVVSFLVLTLMSGPLLAERKEDVRIIRIGEKPEESTRLKFDFVGRSLIVIPVFVNDAGPYKFLLDTGASITVLATRLASKLNLRSGRTGSIASASGKVAVNLRSVETLRIGDIRIRHAEVAVADLELMRSLNLDGIVGANDLRSYSVSIDYPNLHFSRQERRLDFQPRSGDRM
jgi:predicted aspartyl protease